jgi:hypothetical protein
MKPLLTIIFVFMVLSSCQYGRPLLVFPNFSGKEVKIDSSGQKEVHKGWGFLCLRTGVHMGRFSITKTYNKSNQLVKKDTRKNTWHGCCDLPGKLFRKEIYWDTLGRKVDIHYSIIQEGYGAHLLLDSTYYFLATQSVERIKH